MMVSLMSIFDPTTSGFFDMLWSTSFFVFFIPVCNIWVHQFPFFVFFLEVLNFIYFSLKSLKFFEVSFSIFTFIVFFNIEGLIPLSFCKTSQFYFSFCICFPFWFGSILYFFKEEKKLFFSHFTPQGSPLELAFLLVPIELVSLLIRPLALSLRLMANMVAGHMIFSLINTKIMSVKIIFLTYFEIFPVFFTCFEFGVSLIQAYVFASLLYLYWKENKLS